jgi:hypothetical protein
LPALLPHGVLLRRLAHTAGAAAIQEVTPAQLPARMVALYLFVVSLFATALGPASIAPAN